MHLLRGWLFMVVGCLSNYVQSAVLQAPTPIITPVPEPKEASLQYLEQRQVDAISLAQVLITALPLSLRLIAATNLPAVSTILWREFLDDNKPQWFLDLPSDVQSYLITEFGPRTAWPTALSVIPSGTSDSAATVSGNPTGTAVASSQISSADSDISSPTNSQGSMSAVSSPVLSSILVGRSSRSSVSRILTTSMSTSLVSDVATSATVDPSAPELIPSGLTRRQKIGIGVGVPLAFLAATALLLGCCFVLRCQKRRRINGHEPPSSPGFIPRFSFQDRSLGSEHREHQAPLNTTFNRSNQQISDTSWGDDEYEHAAIAASHRRNSFPLATAPMAMHDSTPIMAPALSHTHSSNRARGKRTSYTSLHAVAEVAEPDDETSESPILGRRHSPPRTGPRRPSLNPFTNIPPNVPVGSIQRKPVPICPSGDFRLAKATLRSASRPTLAYKSTEYSSSSSSGLAMSNASSGSGLQHENESPGSPFTHQALLDPFAGEYDYLEDYDPEYSSTGYMSHASGLYGGNRNLDQYPDSSLLQTDSRTEWPLRNVMGSGRKRNTSPMWDRVYESN